MVCLFFFFSSRRRHTRFDCDWSSDVCSSDLGEATLRECRLELEDSREKGYVVEVRAVRIDWDYGKGTDRKSTRLNSSHSQISYAVFCLKKKNTQVSARIEIRSLTRSKHTHPA